MSERYTLSNRKDDQNKSKDQKGKSSKQSSSSGLPEIPMYFWLVLVVVVVLVTNAFTYFVTANIYGKKLSESQQKSDDLAKQLKDAQQNTASNTKSPGISDGNVSSSTKTTLQAIIDAKKYQDLLSSLSDNVTVVVAGSSTTQQTRQQAISSLGFLNNATGQWNWNLTADQLQQLQQGANAQYFGGNAVVGISSDGYVVSLVVDDSGQVTAVFMSPTTQDASPPATGEGRE